MECVKTQTKTKSKRFGATSTQILVVFFPFVEHKPFVFILFVFLLNYNFVKFWSVPRSRLGYGEHFLGILQDAITLNNILKQLVIFSFLFNWVFGLCRYIKGVNKNLTISKTFSFNRLISHCHISPFPP